MKITKEWLKEKGACSEGFEWWLKHQESDVKTLALKLLDAEHFDWASWMLTKCFDKTQSVKYAIFAAEQVIGIYEAKYPDDHRPRKAIEAAKAYLHNPTADAARAAADAAADAAARASADAAYAATDAAYAAADAARAAGAAACAAARAAADAAADAAARAAADAAAYAAVRAAAYAARAAADAADAARAANAGIKKKIIEYGIKLLRKPKGASNEK